jgi:methionyl-tRNA synthetase
MSPAAASLSSSVIAAASSRGAIATRIDAEDADDLEAYHEAIGPKGFLLHDALKVVWQTMSRANEYLDPQTPWKPAKDPAAAGRLRGRWRHW